MNELIDLLGRSESQVLKSSHFEKWAYVKTVDEDLPEHMVRTHYTFASNGIALSFDVHGCLISLFIYSEKYGGFKDFAGGVDFELTRTDVLRLYGAATKQGERSYSPYLGKAGAYVRFDYASHVIHFQFFYDQDRIEMITLMSRDVAP